MENEKKKQNLKNLRNRVLKKFLLDLTKNIQF